MKPVRHLIPVRVSTRARDVLRALDEDRGGIGLGRVAGDVLEMALAGKLRLAGRPTGVALSRPAVVRAVQAQHGRVLASLRAAVAEKEQGASRLGEPRNEDGYLP